MSEAEEACPARSKWDWDTIQKWRERMDMGILNAVDGALSGEIPDYQFCLEQAARFALISQALIRIADNPPKQPTWEEEWEG